MTRERLVREEEERRRERGSWDVEPCAIAALGAVLAASCDAPSSMHSVQWRYVRPVSARCRNRQSQRVTAPLASAEAVPVTEKRLACDCVLSSLWSRSWHDCEEPCMAVGGRTIEAGEI